MARRRSDQESCKEACCVAARLDSGGPFRLPSDAKEPPSRRKGRGGGPQTKEERDPSKMSGGATTTKTTGGRDAAAAKEAEDRKVLTAVLDAYTAGECDILSTLGQIAIKVKSSDKWC